MQENKVSVLVEATTQFIESRSDPETNQYAFGYALTITNHGKSPVRLMRRHWQVKSDNGNVQEVQGEGVVGEQPHILPGGVYQYTSWVMLQTPTGHMEGHYLFITDDGEQSWEKVPPFFFEVPGSRILN
ncbi:MAG: Co2+/Mg2+ efflux protein ApaG [Magnetococcales bacterium]|nr:Co2+/Mg2+ efflux protein ApaG [Magnetococcales bacterium]